MRSKKKKGVRVRPAPSINQIRGDLAVLDKQTFIEEYKCTERQYLRILEQFGVSELVSFLEHLTHGLMTNEIECEPKELRDLVIKNYCKRIIKLNLYCYEKKNVPIVSYLGYC